MYFCFKHCDWVLSRFKSSAFLSTAMSKFTFWYYIPIECHTNALHRNNVIISSLASQITSITIVYSTVYSDADQKENSKVPRHWPFLRGIHRSPVNSPHKWPVTRKMLPFDDVIMRNQRITTYNSTQQSANIMCDSSGVHICLWDKIFANLV